MPIRQSRLSTTMSLFSCFLMSLLSEQPGRGGRAVVLGLKTRLRRRPAIPLLLSLTAY